MSKTGGGVGTNQHQIKGSSQATPRPATPLASVDNLDAPHVAFNLNDGYEAMATWRMDITKALHVLGASGQRYGELKTEKATTYLRDNLASGTITINGGRLKRARLNLREKDGHTATLRLFGAEGAELAVGEGAETRSTLLSRGNFIHAALMQLIDQGELDKQSFAISGN